jgi:hypothetical protein
MLNVEQLESNKNKFKETNKKYSIFSESLENFLGDDFYTAPATTTLDMYGCYPGGLLNHCFKACKYAVKTNELLPEKMRVDVKSILKGVGSDICAIYVIQWDMSGFTSRIEAEDMINVLRDAALRGLSILRDKKTQDFINGA